MPSLRDLLNALGKEELQILAQALDVQVTDRRRKQGFVDALATSRRISRNNLLAALSAKTLKALCELFERPVSGRAREDYAAALAGPALSSAPSKAGTSAKASKKTATKVTSAKAADKQAPATKKAKRPASKATAAVDKAAADKSVPADAPAAATHKGHDEAVAARPAPSASVKKSSASRTKSKETPPDTETSGTKLIAQKSHDGDQRKDSDGDKGAAAKKVSAKAKSKPAAEDKASRKKSALRSKGGKSSKAGSKKERLAQEQTKEAARGTPPRPAVSAPLIGVPRPRAATMAQEAAPQETGFETEGTAQEAVEQLPSDHATQVLPPEPPQPPAAVRRGLVSWAEAASAAERRGQSAESMLGQPANSHEVHDVHQRCPKCKKRVEMHTCQSQQCQNRFVAAPGRRICAECLFERHNLSITDFNARLAEARQCPHCAKPLPERAAG